MKPFIFVRSIARKAHLFTIKSTRLRPLGILSLQAHLVYAIAEDQTREMRTLMRRRHVTTLIIV